MIKQLMEKKLELHKLWIETIAKQGKKLVEDEVDFTRMDVTLKELSLDSASLTECKFDQLDLSKTEFYRGWLCSSTFREATMDYCSFVKAELLSVDFSYATLTYANFVKSDCFETVFFGSHLEYANLTNTLCVRTDFRQANLMHVDITVSKFKNVLLQGANLTGMKGIEEADIESINLGTVEEPIMLEGEKAKHWMVEQANLNL
ncbi:pentapeptide repeat-containing protein [Paenibacillus sp. WLX1005]|uniref:pentapeptide repeat-containing protein n=1 Tax=Paenibacillus sp. WLX1005 TaxID=3243766 RepID=UPI003983FB21